MNTPTGIGCFKGCGNPVIGQCQGFKESCGAFYCNIHSQDKLCEDCNSKKNHEAHILATIEEYTKIAQDMDKRRIGCGFLVASIILLAPGFGGCTGALYSAVSNTKTEDTGVTIGLIAGFLFMFFLFLLKNKNNRSVQEKVNKISQEKLNFAEFYKEWRKEQGIKTLSVAWTIVSAGAAMSESLQKDSMHREVTNTAIEVQKAAKRIK